MGLLSKGVDWKYSGPESRASLPQRLGRAEFSRPVESIPSESETTSDTQCSSFFLQTALPGESIHEETHTAHFDGWNPCCRPCSPGLAHRSSSVPVRLLHHLLATLPRTGEAGES